MSFGFSVGDFITTIELANRIRKEFVDAPNQFKDISDEVKSLSNVFRDIEDFLPERELTTQQQTELYDIAKGCRNVLKDLHEKLEKYQELDCSQKTFGRKARRVWKRLKWEPEDIKELRSRIIANITLLNAFQGRLASQISLTTKDGVDRLHERQDDRERREEHQAILDWLTPIDYAPQQSDYIGRRQSGTGEWLLNSNQFQEWLINNKQTFFCSGIPGAGKTMITSIVVDHLYTKYQNDDSIGIAYLYCNFRRQHEQKPADLLASLLKQLVQEQPSMPESIKNLYERHKSKRTRPSFDEISKALHSIVADFPRSFIIIDALDECQVADGARKRLLSEIFNLQAKTEANFFATSRFFPEIAKEFQRSIFLEIRASDEDVRSYLEGHISRLPSCVTRSRHLQGEIETKVIKAVDGMFLLAQLNLDSLIDKTTPKAVKLALEKLPTGSDALDHAYQEAMERIEGQNTGFQELAKQVLSWITCAKRPMTTLELRHALAIEVGKSELDEENFPEIEDIVSVCAGLVTVDEESDIIRLVHYTTQEYFERTWTSWFPNAQNYIMMNLVTYLSFNIFETGFCRTDEEFEARLRLNPLYDYAARNWGHHARAASTQIEQLTLDFLESEVKVFASSQVMIASRLYPGDSGYSQRVQRQTTGVHLAAYFGLREAVAVLLKNGHDPTFKDSYGRMPLSWAAENGNEAVVKLLLATDGVDANSRDSYGRTPLWWAAMNGHEAVVKLLLTKNGVDPDSKDNNGGTPLSKAAVGGHLGVVKLLLTSNGVNPDSKDVYDQTPLSRAATNGHEMVVKLLLAMDGVNPDSKNECGQTPLSGAAESGYQTAVKLLLASDGIDPDSKNNYGQTPLSMAARNGHEKVVKILLAKRGVNPDSRDIFGQTPLLWAAAGGHEAVVKLLLAKDGVDPNSKNKCGQTQLSLAAGKGHEAVVKLLLAKDDVDLDSKNKYGQTPLSLAVRNGHEAVAKWLLAKHNVDPDSKDNYGRTPLWWAARKGCEAVMELLLAKDGVDVNSSDSYGRMPLWWAATNGHEAVLRLLLATDGVHPDSKDKYGQTPLSGAAESGHQTIVKLLLAKDGVDLNFKDNDGRTPLSWAAGMGHEAVVKTLLTKDVFDLDPKDRYGQTPLLLAAGKGHEAVVKLLLAKGVVNLSSENKFGQTPLSWAARRGKSNVVKILLKKYEENGIAIRFENVSIATFPAADYSSRIVCDICMLHIPDVDLHYHCGICRNGDFDICQESIRCGALCLDHSHQLVKRIVKDGILVEVS